MDFLVTRHLGALHWMRQRLHETGIHLSHLEVMERICPGDRVIGTLPVNLIAAVIARGARFLYLEIDLPAKLRGQELSAEQLAELNPRLVEYVALRVQPDTGVMPLASGRNPS